MANMELVPSKKSMKLFGVSFVVAMVLNIGELFRVNGMQKLIGYFIDTFIYAVVIMVLIRVVAWIVGKIN